MSTNPQITIRRGRSRAPGRFLAAGRLRALAVVVALAATLSNHVGPLAASGPPRSGLGPPVVGQTVPIVEQGASIGGQSASVAGQAASLAGQTTAPVARQGAVAAPRVAARAAILADESTGQVLFERNADDARAMASTTKVMTALLALDRLDEDRVVVIGPGPPQVGEESLRLRQGERLTIRQLLLGLLLKSANDAGVALAEAVDGSEAAFVRRMNRKAAALRLEATHYVTPYGLDRPGHQTSARDLARLWEVAMRRADFRALVASRAARIPGIPLSLRRFVTTNELLGSYRWTVGGKTGFTNQAGRCLVASASRGGRRLVAVALGSPNAFADVRALFEYGFSKFARARVATRGQPVATAPGRPPGFQTDAGLDALIRLDDLARVRLTVPSGSAAATVAWFTGGNGRIGRVRLVQLPASGPAPGTTPGSSAAPTTAGTSGSGVTLTAGTVVRVQPVPPGAPAPTIDPFLRAAPP